MSSFVEMINGVVEEMYLNEAPRTNNPRPRPKSEVKPSSSSQPTKVKSSSSSQPTKVKPSYFSQPTKVKPSSSSQRTKVKPSSSSSSPRRQPPSPVDKYVMSGLNASIGYFLAVVAVGLSVRALLKKWPRLGFLAELSGSLVLAECWLEVQTIVEVGQWAGGLGPDVTVTMLFLVLLSHGVVCGGGAGNPGMSLLRYLSLDEGATLPTTVLALALQFLGAHVGLLAAEYYWRMELTDMHMIKNLMSSSCSSSLLVSPTQGFFTEFICALFFYLVHLSLRRRSALIQVPVAAVLLTFMSHSASGYTSAYINPALAYAMTFQCSGFTLGQYALVYWLGPLTGMTVALFLYMGHIPRIFMKNLLYSQKTRFRVPKAEQGDKKKK